MRGKAALLSKMEDEVFPLRPVLVLSSSPFLAVGKLWATKRCCQLSAIGSSVSRKLLKSQKNKALLGVLGARLFEPDGAIREIREILSSKKQFWFS